MLKILYIITLSEWGGAQKVCYDLATSLDNEKFFVEVACKPGGELIKKLKEKGIKVYEILSFRREISLIEDFKTLILLYKLIKRERYDIVHCHSTKAGFLGRIAAKLAGVKKIYFTAHSWGFYNKEEYGWAQKLLVFLEKIAAPLSTKIICVSEKTKEDGVNRKIAKEDKFLVIRNGINWNIEGDKKEAREKLGVRENDIIFGMVSRLAYPKNPLFFLKAAKEISQNFLKAKFILIGDGPLFSGCKNFLKENNLENKIFLLGEKDIEETQKLLFGFDIFVLTSKFEGLPITVIEAMFAGLPIIATDVGGMKELVTDGENGFLVKFDSTEELIQKMVYFIENPEKRNEMGKKGRKIAQENFSLEKMLKNYEDLYLS